jgi:uncharacterized ubiquitin-like protein YukD
MVDNVIVTVVCNSREYDMELPANIKVEQLKPVVFEALKRKGLTLSGDIVLKNNGSLLKDSDTLFNAGVWDGSYITVA